eukprot:sb/3476548/
MDNSDDREGYSLACGFSLGLILLGMGNDNLPGLNDLRLTDRLYKYMNGGKKDGEGGAVPASFRIWEGNMVNVNVSMIGATIALGLIFLKTGQLCYTPQRDLFDMFDLFGQSKSSSA